MKVTLENYEAFLLDSLEGNLSLEDAADLRDFLAKHPELKMEEELELHLLSPPENITYPNVKNLLFGQINKHNCHHFFIAYWENELQLNEKNAVLKWLKENPHYTRVFENYKNCLFIPDKNIFYSNKKELYQNISINRGLFNKLGIVAGFIGFLILIPLLFFNNSSELAPKYVQNESEITKLKIAQQNSEIVSEGSINIEVLNPVTTRKFNDIKKSPLSESTTTGKSSENQTLSTDSMIDDHETTDMLNQLTALNVPMPLNESEMEYIDLSFYGSDFMSTSKEKFASNNIISGIIQKLSTAYRNSKMLDNIPEIPASIKSMPSRIQQSSLLAQDDADVKVIRLRFMGVTVEHTKVLEDQE